MSTTNKPKDIPFAYSETILAHKRELDEENIRTINARIDYLTDKRDIQRSERKHSTGSSQ